MKRKFIMAFIAIGFVIAHLALTGCKDEEETPTPAPPAADIDIRDLSEGAYTGIEIFTLNGSPATDEHATITVLKSANGKSLKIVSANVVFETDEPVGEQKAFSGNIPTQEVDISGTKATIYGRGKNNEHFTYADNGKTFVYELSIIGNGLSGIISFVGTKQ